VPISLPAVVLGYFAVAVVYPLVRMRRLTGSFGLSLFDRSARPARRLIGLGLAICAAGVPVWTLAYRARGPGQLSVWTAPPWLEAAGWLGIFLGALVTIAAQGQMGLSWRMGIDPAHTALVTKGLYAYIRNPIFTGMQMTLAGVVALAPSPWSAAIAAAAFVLLHAQVRAEEHHLTALHGDYYLAYASKIGRFVPGIGRLTQSRT
jgi:protein-S-isoprenylcysteine O-methyltransferase Ste14